MPRGWPVQGRSPGSPPSLPSRPRHGAGGFAYQPITAQESPLVLNMVADRAGVWRPRHGLTARGSAFSNLIRHVSQRPWKDGESYAGNRIVVIEGNALRLVSHTAYTNTLADGANWGTNEFYPFTVAGPSGNDQYWIAPRLGNAGAAAGYPGPMYRFNSAGTYAAIAGSPPNALWAQAFGAYTLAMDKNLLYYSAENNCDSWSTGSQVFRLRREMGDPVGIMVYGYGQSLLFGTEGVVKFTGTRSDQFRMEPLYNFGCANYSCLTRTSGYDVIMMGPGNTLWIVTPNKLERIDYPIHWAIAAANPRDFRAWYDPVLNWYLLSQQTESRTFVFDCSRNVWLGIIDKALVGQATIYDSASVPFQRRFVGVGTQLCEWEEGVYTDQLAAMSCGLQTPPTVLGGPDQEKQLDKIYIDAQGTATGTLYYRDTVGDPNDNWSTYSLGSVACPGYLYGDNKVFKEFKLDIRFTAGATVFLREVLADVHVRGGMIRLPILPPLIEGPGVGYGYGAAGGGSGM